MEVYKRETQEVIKRFLARRLSFPECIAALDAALAEFSDGFTLRSGSGATFHLKVHKIPPLARRA
jgi:hypothetical protein